MTELSGTTVNTSSATESSFRSSCRRSSWICLFSAVAYTVALFVAIYLIQRGALSDLSPVKLLNFIPENIIVWKAALLFAALANLSFLTFIVAFRETFEQNFKLFFNIAIAFGCVGSACMLTAVFSMMILFADISILTHTQSDYLHSDIPQMAWMTLDQALSQAILIGNSLYAISGLIIIYCIASSNRYAHWLGWLALPIPLFCLSISVTTFIGCFQWSLLLGFVTTAMYVIWLLILGLMLRAMARSIAVI